MTNLSLKVAESLQEHCALIAPVISELTAARLQWLDLTEENASLREVNLKDTAAFSHWLFERELQGSVGIGGYMEDRVVYRRSEHYEGQEARSVHLGLDLWVAAGTPVYAPLAGAVHSFQDNQGFGNYGPTIILEHTLDEVTFYTLYGHLSRASLTPLRVGQPIECGAPLGAVGPYPENGDWPPHLHLQVITDLMGWVGDFPGVVAPSQQAAYARVCVDPLLLVHTHERGAL